MTKINLHNDVIPQWVRIGLGLISLGLIALGIIDYVKPELLFYAASMVSSGQCASPATDTYVHVLPMISYLLASRDLAIGLALLIVSMRGIPESITIVTIICALVALQMFILDVTGSRFIPILIIAPILFIFEIMVIKTMIGLIRKRGSQQV